MLFKKIRYWAIPFLLVILLLIATLLFANILIQKPSIQTLLIEKLSDATDLDIKTGKIELNLWHGFGLSIQGFKAGSRRRDESIQAARVRIILDAWALFEKRIMPLGIHLFQPEIKLNLTERQEVRKKGISLGAHKIPVFWIPGMQSLVIEKGQISITDTPYYLEDFSLDIREISSVPITLSVSSNGTFGLKGGTIPFNLKGTILPHQIQGMAPSFDIAFETGEAPVDLIPLGGMMRVRDGDFKTRIKISGAPGRKTGINGQIFLEPFRYSVNADHREKEFFLPHMTLEFESYMDGKGVTVPLLYVKNPDLLLDISLKLDLEDENKPHLELAAKSEFMKIGTFKDLFPSPLLPPWIENRLFPLLNRGSIRLGLFALKGSFDQIQNPGMPDNQSVMEVRLECQDFEVAGSGFPLPFKQVSAEVILEQGDFRVSHLKAGFGNSSITDAGLSIQDIFGESLSLSVSVEGSFNIQELLAQRKSGLIPFHIRHPLDQIESLTGDLECKALFGYKDDWDFPRILEGTFIYRDCLLEQKALLLPLSIEKAEFQLDEDNLNRFSAHGSWGRSPFDMSGSFGIIGKDFRIKRTEISADIDMNQVLPAFKQSSKGPVTFSAPVNCRVSAERGTDSWSLHGKVDLEGVVLENNTISIDPPGHNDSILFDLIYMPGVRVDLKRSISKFGTSYIKLAGSHTLNGTDMIHLDLSTGDLSLEDLGIRYKKTGTHLRGDCSGDIMMDISRINGGDTTLWGHMEAQDLFLDTGRFSSPIHEGSFRVDLEGKKVGITSCDMMIGKSPLSIRGDLTGWNGLKGALHVESGFIDTADIFSPGDSSLPDNEVTDQDGFVENCDIAMDLNIKAGHWRRLAWGPARAHIDLWDGDLFIKSSTINLEHGSLDVRGYVQTGKEREMSFSGDILLTDQPVDELLNSILTDYGDIKGSLSMTADLSIQGKGKKDLISSLSGQADVSIREGLIKKSRVFIKVLDFLSLQKIFRRRPPDLREEGFYFESILAHAKIHKGILWSEDFVMKSPIFNAVAYGEADLTGKTVDFTLGAQPHGIIDSLISKIPILGYIITGEKESIIAYPFKVKGPSSNPKVSFAPIEGLGKGIAGVIKRLFLTPARMLKEIRKGVKSNQIPPSTNPE